MLFTFFILLLCSPTPISSLTYLSRRILHQPFFPSDSASPPPPPPPSNPKYPFSTSASNPNPSPFFPSYPSPPAPPPSASTLASFPANVSSLVVPHSKSSSSKLVGVTIAAVVVAVVVVAVAAFFFCRRRNSEFSDDKTSRSGTSHRLFPVNGNAPANGSRKLTTPSTNSSEFLYLGTLATSRGNRIDNHTVSRNNGGDNGSLDSRKMDSPELHPLPPLKGRSFRQSWRKGDVNSNDDETEEEFYSPRGSLGGQESFCGTGSESRRVDAAMAAEKFEAISTESSSCSSSSSSSSNSPARSHSISPSPPASLSPRKFPPISLDSVGIQAAPPSPSGPDSTPERDLDKDDDGDDKSPRISSGLFPFRSPSLSPACLSPGRGLTTNPDMSLRTWNVSDRNGDSSSASLASSPPLGRIPIASPRISNVSDQLMQSLSLSSPDSDLKKFPVASPRVSNVSNQIKQSLSMQSSRSSSPERGFGKIPNASARVSDVSNQTTPNESPRISSSDRNTEFPARISNALPQLVSVPPPPPPPLPPQQLPQRQGETPIHSTPTCHQPINKPPALIPPSMPSLLQSPTKVSPIQIPASSETTEKIEETTKPKLKPLHWDKVRASSDREMVWDQLRSSSFKLNEEMIETLFIVNTPKPKEPMPCPVLPSPNQENRVLDPKKSQNIAISLRALNVTIEEVCEALLEGNVDTLGTELLESLLKMAPTKEEERKLKECKDNSPIKLGPAEKFLKAVLDVPFAFKRVDAMLYIANFDSEIEYLKKSFETLEAACEELRSSRMFLKLLEAVLKTGNRMNVGTNRGDAHAFKLDTLLKLVDVKGADGRTTLLHFVVQEIIRTEGSRLSGSNQAPSSTLNEDAKCRKLGLQVVSGISSELGNVKKAATMDSDVLSNDVSKLSKGIGNIGEVVRLTETMSFGESSQNFSESMNKFMRMAEENIIKIQAQESVALSLVKEITEYFHGNSAREEAHPFRIFMVVRDFLAILDRVCKEVSTINDRTLVSSAHKFPVPVNPMLLVPVLPVFPGRQQYNSSDDEDASP